MKLVTVATHSDRYFPYLELSAKRYGHDLVVLGWGEKWQGFTWRFRLMKEYLETLQNNEVVCFIDAYDVIILEDPATIEKKFKNAIGDNKDRIFISRDNLDNKPPFTKFAMNTFHNMMFNKCKGYFICAGTYIGYSSTILKVLKGLCEEFECAPDKDDQILLQYYCKKYEDLFLIDVNSDIFLITNCNLTSKINEKEEGISYDGNKLKYGSHYPSIIHGPGNARLDDIIEHLGYDKTIYIAPINDSINYHLKSMNHFIRVLFRKQFAFLILLFTILFTLIMYYIRDNKNMPTTSRNVRSRH
jgi:hypothetical protein